MNFRKRQTQKMLNAAGLVYTEFLPEQNPLHIQIRSGTKHILSLLNVPRIQDEIPGRMSFSLFLPGESIPCIIKLSAANDNFEATIPPFKPASVKNNMFDVNDNVDECEKLLGYLREIYRYYKGIVDDNKPDY